MFTFPTESRNLDKDNCTIEDKGGGIVLELCVQYEVIGVRGEDVILPCQFYHSNLNILKDLRLLVKNKGTKGNVVYNSSSNETREDFKGRIELVGNPSSGDGTVSIRHLRMGDQGVYLCRFEWTKSNGKKEGFSVGNRKTTNLQVDGKFTKNVSHYNHNMDDYRLYCKIMNNNNKNVYNVNMNSEYRYQRIVES